MNFLVIIFLYLKMRTLQIYNDDAVEDGGYMYHSADKCIYQRGNKGFKKLKTNETIIIDALRNRIFCKKGEEWEYEHLCDEHVVSVQTINVSSSDIIYQIPCVGCCVIKYTQLPYCCGIVTLSTLSPGSIAIVILKCRDGLYIYIFVKEQGSSTTCPPYMLVSGQCTRAGNVITVTG